jgi:hypothetical protein
VSKITIDPLVYESSRPLKYAGQVWHERLVVEQLPFARQMASLLSVAGIANTVDCLGSWVSGEESNAEFYPWSVKPADVLVQGPATWGYDPETLMPKRGAASYSDLSRSRAYLTADGTIIETTTGDIDTLPEGLTLAEQTVWFIPRPTGTRPVMLISEKLTLVEGTGFILSPSWILLYRNPFDLWPDGTVVSMSARLRRSWKSTTLKADHLFTSGREVAKYKRNTQNLKQFELALCELAGLPVLDREGYVVKIETCGSQILHWLDDGRSFELPIESPYVVGSLVPAHSGHILQLRHEGFQGEDWWRSRYWGARGIPIFMLRPNFYGFAVKDEYVPAVSYDDDGALRAKLIFNQDPEAENRFWSWQAAQEKKLGVQTFAVDILGLDSDYEPLLQTNGHPVYQGAAGGAYEGDPIYVRKAQDPQLVNGLEVFMSTYGPWFAVVETSLDKVNRVAFNEVMDFVERERPAGMQVFVAGTSSSYSVQELYDVYLNTGELVELQDASILSMPMSLS